VTNASSRSPSRSLGITPVRWTPPDGEMEHSEWVAAGRRLGSISRCNQWWLGDWVRYGAARWGEKYSEAARATGYDSRSLANMASIASAFPPSRRRDNLTWSHHAAVVSLDSGEQDRWLDLATSERFSVADLRIELRSRMGVSAPPPGSRSSSKTSGKALIAVCPRCGHEIHLSGAVTGATFAGAPYGLAKSTKAPDQPPI
jgi:hypothetical protein